MDHLSSWLNCLVVFSIAHLFDLSYSTSDNAVFVFRGCEMCFGTFCSKQQEPHEAELEGPLSIGVHAM